MKKHSNSGKKSEPRTKGAKSRGPVQRDTKEVLAELVRCMDVAMKTVPEFGLIVERVNCYSAVGRVAEFAG